MDFYPSRRLGLLFGGLLLFAAVGLTLVSIFQLAAAEISPLLILWVVIPILGAPAAAFILFQIYGLLTARYRVDREGVHISWGMALESIPIAEISGVIHLDQVSLPSLPGPGPWWPGCVTGKKTLEGHGEVEFFGTDLRYGATLIRAGGRRFAITPADPEGFAQGYESASRLGSLAPISWTSRRPNFLVTQIGADPLGRGLILAGLALPLTLLAYLTMRVPRLPVRVPAGFGPGGFPTNLGPPSRLLLLPMISGFVWAADLLLGMRLFRRPANRLLAYVVWAAAVLVGLLFWGAVLQLLPAS
jgi:phosphate/sulfate permease